MMYATHYLSPGCDTFLLLAVCDMKFLRISNLMGKCNDPKIPISSLVCVMNKAATGGQNDMFGWGKLEVKTRTTFIVCPTEIIT